MKYGLRDVELETAPAHLSFEADEDGLAVIMRDRGRLVGFHLQPRTSDETLSTASLVDDEVREAVAVERLRELATMTTTACTPTITAAICSKDRPRLVDRALTSLDAVRGDEPLDILVVDNGSATDALERVCRGHAGVRFVREPRVGLDFARNRALAESAADVVAFLDDDVCVDRNWLWAMQRAWTQNPDAGCVTGLVLPLLLETHAQVLFEQRGGFRRGFRPFRFAAERYGETLHPCAAGRFGAGANMSVRRTVALAVGGFDEALDTGRPLPGGGDLDMFYRVLRAGAILVYEPQAAVYHEHRRDLSGLGQQYYTWGLGFAAFVAKSIRTDPGMAPRFRRTLLYWLVYQSRRLVARLRGQEPTPIHLILAEIGGLAVGSLGEYRRSVRRVEAIRAEHTR